MSFPGFALGAGLAEEHKAQNAQKQDEERQAQLVNIANAGLPPEATQEAIRTLYAKDPSALKQHIQNLIGRVQGKQPQPTPEAYPAQSATVQGQPTQVGDVTLPAPQTTVNYPGAKTQAERRAQILSGGTTPQQRQQSLIESQGAQRVKEIEAKPTLAPYKTYVSPDGKERQAFRVDEQPEGWQIAPTGSSGATIPEAKPLEAGGVPYGVQTKTGQT